MVIRTVSSTHYIYFHTIGIKQIIFYSTVKKELLKVGYVTSVIYGNRKNSPITGTSKIPPVVADYV